jgi:D-beta-D-heptose 7-phosphate kinase/D-beta-D-heptose 1-phosphate adenosyltransferase
MRGKRVLCFGDVMLDRYVMGDVRRISPEAPIPVLTQTLERTMLGAAGNVARNVAAMGATAVLVGLVGDDASAHEATRLMAQESGMEGELIAIRGRPTTVKTRLMSGGQQLLRVDHEDTSALDAKTEATLIEVLADEVARADLVLVSDYAKGAVTDEALATIAEVARAKKTPVLVDPKGRDFYRYGPIQMIKPNARELADLTHLPCDTDDQIHAALAKALDYSHADVIVVTRGPKGMAYLTRAGEFGCVPAVARAVYDVSGAGDTSLAALGLMQVAGAGVLEALRAAILASGIVVEKIGAATATPEEIIHAAETGVRPRESKVMPYDRLLEQVTRWRLHGLRVGFTNGCFDLLHPGHVALLADARGTCDRLVVAINSDASVSRLKGPTRPVNPEAARAAVLAAVQDVDAVVSFEEDTPLRLIEGLKPDVLIKGADYTRDQVVGADVVEAHGGRVVLIPLREGYSTTGTIARMSEAQS